MKKKVFILVSICLVVAIGILLFIILTRNKSNVASTITLDINPSVELGLDKKNNVVSVKPLNKDAKRIVDDSLIGKSLDNAVEKIADKVIEEDLTDDNGVTIFLYASGKIKTTDVDEILKREFSKRSFHAEVITIKSITNEDKKLAERSGKLNE